jgi:hypothetical protein
VTLCSEVVGYDCSAEPMYLHLHGKVKPSRLYTASHGVQVPASAGNFSLHHRVQVLRSVFLGIKLVGHEADHSTSSSADVKNAWRCTSTPPIHLHGVVLS